jgi:hypothetical protein
LTLNLSALIDFADPHDAAAPRLRHAFAAPRALWVARTPDEVRPVLTAVEAAAQQGAWCVGFVRYEAAPAFDAALATHAADGPLAWFAVHDAPLPWPAQVGSPATVPAFHPRCIGRACPSAPPSSAPLPPSRRPSRAVRATRSTSRRNCAAAGMGRRVRAHRPQRRPRHHPPPRAAPHARCSPRCSAPSPVATRPGWTRARNKSFPSHPSCFSTGKARTS